MKKNFILKLIICCMTYSQLGLAVTNKCNLAMPSCDRAQFSNKNAWGALNLTPCVYRSDFHSFTFDFAADLRQVISAIKSKNPQATINEIVCQDQVLKVNDQEECQDQGLEADDQAKCRDHVLKDGNVKYFTYRPESCSAEIASNQFATPHTVTISLEKGDDSTYSLLLDTMKKLGFPSSEGPDGGQRYVIRNPQCLAMTNGFRCFFESDESPNLIHQASSCLNDATKIKPWMNDFSERVRKY